MDAQRFREQFDEDGYVILRDFIPIELMNNARLALGRIVDALAEERVANGDIPHALRTNRLSFGSRSSSRTNRKQG